MAGVGKILKQAQKMQKQIEAIQQELASKVIEASAGGGAVTVKASGQGELLSIRFDPEFLKEEPSLVEETTLEAVKKVLGDAKALHEESMQKVTSGFQLPGFI